MEKTTFELAFEISEFFYKYDPYGWGDEFGDRDEGPEAEINAAKFFADEICLKPEKLRNDLLEIADEFPEFRSRAKELAHEVLELMSEKDEEE